MLLALHGAIGLRDPDGCWVAVLLNEQVPLFASMLV